MRITHAWTRGWNRRALLAGALCGLMAVAACHPGDISDVEELDLVVTRNDKDVNFADFRSYAMPDEVFDLADDANNQWDGQFDTLILSEIADNLAAVGFSRIVPVIDTDGNPTWPNGEPDVIVLAGGLKVKGYVATYPPGYPGYPWYPGWGYGYPWPSVYEYEKGTIVVNMLKFDDRNEDDETFLGVWQAALNGAATGSASSVESRITNGLAQAFKQSPYLGGN